MTRNIIELTGALKKKDKEIEKSIRRIEKLKILAILTELRNDCINEAPRYDKYDETPEEAYYRAFVKMSYRLLEPIQKLDREVQE